ncbi:MAG: GTP 3',8-cyclase MoaA [bacterium]|nr:GTP 3',8-cyclase MoaA [bacterium]
MKDRYGREIEYVRISITDRCNLKCFYCSNFRQFVPLKHSEILTYEEILRLIQILTEFGIKKVRITGGEPLVRKGVGEFLKEIKKIGGVERLTLTTNGTLLTRYIDDISEAKVDSVNVSLDSLKENTFAKITGLPRLPVVVEGIKALKARGIQVKMNTVYTALNIDEVEELVHFALKMQIPLRFIELMPFGSGWENYYVPEAELIERLGKLGPMEEMGKRLGDGPARYIKLNLGGEDVVIGLIAAMSHKFCDYCNRIRITADGKLLPCMASRLNYDLKEILRNGDEEKLRETIRWAIYYKPLGHNLRKEAPNEMRRMGG